MSQSSALEPGNSSFCRKCKRKTTAIIASAMEMALVAIIARDAEVVMMESSEMPFKPEKERKGFDGSQCTKQSEHVNVPTG